MIRFGAPVFIHGEQPGHGAQPVDPIALAHAHHAKGYRAAYVPKITLQDTAAIRDLRAVFAREDIMLAEVGYWENLVDRDPVIRAQHRRQMIDVLALADELGARCAVNIFGSYCHGHGTHWHTAENFSAQAFDEAVAMAREFIDAVKPRTAFFTYEIFPFSVVDSPAEIARLIAAVDRKQFGVHLDLVNLINSPRTYWRSGDVMRDCIRLFGDRIVAAHAKDVKLKEPAQSVILEEVMPGEGGLDIATFVRELHRLPHEVPLMLEHQATEADYDQAAAHYRRVAADEGIHF